MISAQRRSARASWAHAVARPVDGLQRWIGVPLAAVVVTTALFTTTTAAGAQAAKPAELLSRAEYEACQSRDEQSFRTTIETLTLASLRRSAATFDYASAVADAWRAQSMDDIIDKRVDAAVAEVGNERSWAELLQSLASTDKSKELATAVAERVYRSDAIKTGIEAVTGDVSRALGSSLEVASQDAAEPAITCLKAFLGPRYGVTIAQAVVSDAQRDFGLDAAKSRAGISSGAVLSQSSGGITGAAILLVRNQLANMAARVSQRIVGSVLSRLVSVAAGGVGAVLIAKDIWELRSGVLPIIATEMKSKATKDLIKAELAKSIAEQISDQMKDVSTKSAGRIIDIWHEFRRAHAKSLDIADRNEAFRAFLDQTTATNLPRLDEVVGLVLASEGQRGGGEAALLARLSNGSLDTAVNKLSPDAMTIARESRSLDSGLGWSAVAGSLLPKVVQHELHKRAAADDFSFVSLSQLLSIDDKVAISRLAGQTREARATLFELGPTSLKTLARALSEQELGGLSGYLTGLEAAPRAAILKAVAAAPNKMRVLATTRIKDAILSSKDQTMAVEMMLREGSGSMADITADFKGAYDGKINPWLLLDRHPGVIALGIVPLLVLVLLLWRVFAVKPRPGRPAAVA